ncbi:ERF family protein [Zhongshania sp.]|uniref:ERF family protein n=1 Tax=Zhongshania sp. TaxID=1971902 RepID=UPI00356ADF3F
MSEKNIYQRINAVMQKVEYVRKDASVQGYRAVTHDMVTAVIRRELVAKGIVVHLEQLKSELLERRDKEKGVSMHLYSGDYAVSFVNIDNPEDRVTVTINAHAADTGDKAPGKAASYATKYAMLKVFSLETGENEESRTAEQFPYTAIQKATFDELLESKNALGFTVFAQTVGPEIMTALNGSFEKGQVSSGKKLCKELETEGWKIIEDYALQIQEHIKNQDPALGELVDELTPDEKRLVVKKLTQSDIEYLRSLKSNEE